MLELFASVMLIYIVYYLVSVKKFDKSGNIKIKANVKVQDLKKESYKALPVETKYFIKKYNIDLDKINIKGLLKVVALTLGIDIAIITIIIALISNDIVIQILVGSVFLIPMYLLSLRLLAISFKKKGLTKSEGNNKHNGNRK